MSEFRILRNGDVKVFSLFNDFGVRIEFEMPRFTVGTVGSMILRYTFKIQVQYNHSHPLPLFEVCPSQRLDQRKLQKRKL